MTGRALAVWFATLVVAILNGGAREAWFIPRFGTQAGHQVSTVMLSVAILLLALLTIGWIGARTAGDAILIGMGWLALTLLFEFGAGHYAFGKPWSELLADYDVMRGRIWIVVLITTGTAPLAAIWARGLTRQ